MTETLRSGETAAGDPGSGGDARRPVGRARSARAAALAVGVVLVVFVGLLATRPSSEDRFGPSPLVGHAVPEVAGPTLSGARFDIDNFRGRWVVVNFFATWCIPCRTEHPELVRFSEEHARLGDAVVVSVVYDDQDAAVRTFFRERGGDWPVIVGSTGPIALAFGVTGVPESYVVAPGGIVYAKFNGVTRAALDEVIADGARRGFVVGTGTSVPGPAGTAATDRATPGSGAP